MTYTKKKKALKPKYTKENTWKTPKTYPTYQYQPVHEDGYLTTNPYI